MNFKSFSAFGNIVTKPLTVADIIAPIQTAVSKLNEVIVQRTNSTDNAKQQVQVLELRIAEDLAEINNAKSVQEKLQNLMI